MSIDLRDVVQGIKLSKKHIETLSSEKNELKSKVAQVEADYVKQAQLVEAQKIAMSLVLDEDTIREINEKTAQIASKDLKVVKEALDLSLLSKSASLGSGTSSNSKLATGDALMDYLTNWSNSRKKE